MTAEIIEFSARHRMPTATTRVRPRIANVALSKLDATLTHTATNSRLRAERREAWRESDARIEYWRTLLHFTDAVHIGQRYDMAEAIAHPNDDSYDRRRSILESYRKAIRDQLLTPAPDMMSVDWKCRKLRRSILTVRKELVDEVIADDIAFLKSDPTRKSRVNDA
jgi:hypothetical protein